MKGKYRPYNRGHYFKNITDLLLYLEEVQREAEQADREHQARTPRHPEA